MQHDGITTPEQQAQWKLQAARAAVEAIPSGAVIGLGSGSTAELMVRALAERVHDGLRVTGVPTSERTKALASSLGIPLAELDDVASLDLSIDGADEVTLPDLDLVKGRGGALLREKLIASASRFRIIIVDESKIVPVLGGHYPIPIEIEPFGWRHTTARVEALGGQAVLRPAVVVAVNAASEAVVRTPYVTDGGHYLLDTTFGAVRQPAELDARIKALRGVVDHGLFIDMTERVYIAGSGGVRMIEKPRP